MRRIKIQKIASKNAAESIAQGASNEARIFVTEDVSPYQRMKWEIEKIAQPILFEQLKEFYQIK